MAEDEVGSWYKYSSVLIVGSLVLRSRLFSTTVPAIEPQFQMIDAGHLRLL
jgi:hypothetical protein